MFSGEQLVNLRLLRADSICISHARFVLFSHSVKTKVMLLQDTTRMLLEQSGVLSTSLGLSLLVR